MIESEPDDEDKSATAAAAMAAGYPPRVEIEPRSGEAGAARVGLLLSEQQAMMHEISAFIGQGQGQSPRSSAPAAGKGKGTQAGKGKGTRSGSAPSAPPQLSGSRGAGASRLKQNKRGGTLGGAALSIDRVGGVSDGGGRARRARVATDDAAAAARREWMDHELSDPVTVMALWDRLQRSPATNKATSAPPGFEGDAARRNEWVSSALPAYPCGLAAAALSEPIARWAHHQRLQRVFARRTEPGRPSTMHGPGHVTDRSNRLHHWSSQGVDCPSPPAGQPASARSRQSPRTVPTLYKTAMTKGVGSPWPVGPRGVMEREFCECPKTNSLCFAVFPRCRKLVLYAFLLLTKLLLPQTSTWVRVVYSADGAGSKIRPWLCHDCAGKYHHVFTVFRMFTTRCHHTPTRCP